MKFYVIYFSENLCLISYTFCSVVRRALGFEVLCSHVIAITRCMRLFRKGAVKMMNGSCFIDICVINIVVFSVMYCKFENENVNNCRYDIAIH